MLHMLPLRLARNGAKRYKPGPETIVSHEMKSGLRVEDPKYLLLPLDAFRRRFFCEPEDMDQRTVTIRRNNGVTVTGVPYLAPGQDPDALVLTGFSEAVASKVTQLDSSKDQYRSKPPRGPCSAIYFASTRLRSRADPYPAGCFLRRDAQ